MRSTFFKITIVVFVTLILLYSMGYRGYVTTGWSMMPAIAEGARVVGRLNVDYEVGDIIFFEQGNLTVVHRVVLIYDDRVICQGDNNSFSELVPRSAVVGKVVLIVNTQREGVFNGNLQTNTELY